MCEALTESMLQGIYDEKYKEEMKDTKEEELLGEKPSPGTPGPQHF